MKTLVSAQISRLNNMNQF